ncbi:inner membrane transport protein ydiM [Bacillus atrophaeus subsp. globigii]|jgi:MFS family permease|uniref:YfkL n=4 Tax=Bacillus atrophaeus TaxID=1452 RepID=A0ABN3Z5N8_BACA1|nr:MFS transporter [Bacillus atrophaeus]AMR63751.1 MFS transporter [Bacillus subtilis subsp. globigii]ADP31264.1 YfkL [Bacillus atrophaeus 1942]AIK47515.1 inner membrane transport protein ydiM [Bacillus atrophaeus subsp. globigii]ARW05861.1 Inner membrane transport protein YdiM [Bacillus atrophaeus]KFK81214.1 inner membrane transport protein ydiM [Bacillus atrophaeus]
MKNQYTKMAIGLYINYFLLGMVNIILASNMESLSKQLGTTAAGISYLVSAIGIGKLVSLAVAGRLSDKYGRKPFVVAASFIYLIFLIGIPLAPNYALAFIFAVSAGIANSFLDSGTYPALIEGFPKKASSATVLVKAFVSIGATLLPFFISFIVAKDLFYGYTFFLPAIIYFINGFFLLKVAFPNHNQKDAAGTSGASAQDQFKSQPKLRQEGLAIIILGFTSTALFVLVQVWLPKFGQEVLGMPEVQSVQLLSYYSVGALVSVLLLAVLLNKVIKPVTVMIVYPAIALVSLLALLFIHQPAVSVISSFVIGLSTAGVFQLAMTVMAELFPANKGTITSFVNTAASLAFILIPLVTGILSKSAGLTSVFMLDVGIAVISILLALFIGYRYKQVMR